jgi:hypothetical protein
MPTTPTLPACDTAGTQGRFSVGPDANGNPIFVTSGGTNNYWIIGSGRLVSFLFRQTLLSPLLNELCSQDYPVFGTGNSLSGHRYLASDLSNSAPNCGNVYHIISGTAAAGLIDTQIALNCGGNGGKVNAPFTFVVNNQVTSCIIYNYNDGSGTFAMICGANAGAATACSNSIIQANAGQLPNAALSTPHFAFYPN